MKKLLIFTILLALLSTGAFAEATWGGTIGATADIIAGSSVEDSDMTTEAYPWRQRFTGDAENEDGTFGGYMRFDVNNAGVNPIEYYGYAWWKPMDMLKLQVGRNADGDFGADGVTRWGYYGDAGDTHAATENWHFGSSFYGGFGDSGAVLTITPAETVTVSFGIPYHLYGNKAEESYKNMNAQLAVDLEGTGKIAITLAASQPFFHIDGFDVGENMSYNKVYGYFGLTSIENLAVDIGLGLGFPVKGDHMGLEGVKYSPGAAFGVGVTFDADALQVKARVQMEMLEKVSHEDIDPAYKGPVILTADVMPSFAIDDTFRFFFSVGMRRTAEKKYDGNKLADSTMGWHLNPYISKAVGPGTFFAGFWLGSEGEKYFNKDGDEKTVVTWRVPVGLVFNF